MLLSEEQRKSFIDRLLLTTAKSGEYIIMPNAANPAFLVPIDSRKIFIKGLALIKPISGKGEVKKRLLSYLPPKWLKNKLAHLHLENPNESHKNTIILPWSQKICDKLTYISFSDDMTDITVHKYAFTEETRKMVRNEFNYLSKLKPSNKLSIKIPAIKGFEDGEEYTCLMQDFVDGMHAKRITPSVSSFFNSLNSDKVLPLKDHPYLNNRMPEVDSYLKEINEGLLLKELKLLHDKYQSEKFHVATMHSDFSSSNTVLTPKNECVIIDWEDACDDGICIDAEYFNFRRKLLNKESWLIKNAEQFLAVFHYVHFMVKKKNTSMLRKFHLKEGEFSLLAS